MSLLSGKDIISRRWDSGAPPSPRRYSRRSPTRTSKSPRRRHSYKERSGKDSKSSKGSQKERSRSRSRRGLNKERGSQKPLTRVKTEPAAQPALEAEKGMGLEIAAVELQMSPVTPRESEDVPDQAFNSPKGKSFLRCLQIFRHNCNNA